MIKVIYIGNSSYSFLKNNEEYEVIEIREDYYRVALKGNLKNYFIDMVKTQFIIKSEWRDKQIDIILND